MGKRAENEGFRMLDDFVCEAIHAADVPRADDRHQGQNEGMRVVEELVFDIPGGESKREGTEDLEIERLAGAINLHRIRRLAAVLAPLIARQSDPAGTLARFQQE